MTNRLRAVIQKGFGREAVTLEAPASLLLLTALRVVQAAVPTKGAQT